MLAFYAAKVKMDDYVIVAKHLSYIKPTNTGR